MITTHQLSQRCDRFAVASTRVQRPLLPRTTLPAVATPSRRAQSRRTQTQAVKDEQKPDVAQVADSIGLPTEEGLFGFKPFAEVWVGRLAMAGFATSCVMEFLTGKGTLQQVGLLTPNDFLLYFIIALASGTSVFAFGRTLSRALSGNMSQTELKRYGGFLGLSNEAKQISQTETDMKQGWKDRPDSPPESLTGSASDTPTDTFKSEEAASARTTVLPEDAQFQNPGMRYARDVELSNGRAAMLGFLGTVAFEAATGKGILSQVIWWFKLSGILGKASGF